MAKKKTAKTKAKKETAIAKYLRETRAELRRVHWPKRQEAWNLTKIVIVVTFSMAIFLGILDYLFAMELSGLIGGNAIAIGAMVVVLVISVLAVVILNRQRA